jgi:hypothetical protein
VSAVATIRQRSIVFQDSNHSYLIDGVIWPSVTQILGAFDRGLDHVDQDVLSRKAALGSAVHRACELDDKRELDEESVHAEVRPYLRQWRQFVTDVGVEVLENEHIVLNEAHRYVGTNDRLVKFGRFKRAVLDIKSGMKRPWHEWQTGGYKAAADRYDSPVDGRCCVYLTPTQYKLVVHDDATDPSVFLNMAACWHGMRRKGALK